ncbi:MAG: hypothetical protein J0I40_09875, partial [Cellulomonas sp.]|nr:hypothetical protein [Cellulomonas sp.]
MAIAGWKSRLITGELAVSVNAVCVPAANIRCAPGVLYRLTRGPIPGPVYEAEAVTWYEGAPEAGVPTIGYVPLPTVLEVAPSVKRGPVSVTLPVSDAGVTVSDRVP